MYTGSGLLPENIVYRRRVGGVSDDDSVLFIDFFLCTNKINWFRCQNLSWAIVLERRLKEKTRSGLHVIFNASYTQFSQDSTDSRERWPLQKTSVRVWVWVWRTCSRRTLFGVPSALKPTFRDARLALASPKSKIAVLCCDSSTIRNHPWFTRFYYHPPLLS